MKINGIEGTLASDPNFRANFNVNENMGKLCGHFLRVSDFRSHVVAS